MTNLATTARIGRIKALAATDATIATPRPAFAAAPGFPNRFSATDEQRKTGNGVYRLLSAQIARWIAGRQANSGRAIK